MCLSFTLVGKVHSYKQVGDLLLISTKVVALLCYLLCEFCCELFEVKTELPPDFSSSFAS